MKKLISMITTLTLLLGVLSTVMVTNVSAASLNDNLVTHWDFTGENPLEDKAAKGAKKDILVADDTSAASIANGTITIKNGGSLYAEDSADFFRTADDRSVTVYFRTDANGTNPLELMSQNGALRWFSQNNGAQFNASTSSDAMGENGIWSSGVTFQPNTWYFLALIQDKGTVTEEEVTKDVLYYKMYAVVAGSGSYIANFTKKEGDSGVSLDHDTTWTRNTNNKNDNNLYIGRRHSGTNASGDHEFADIRIYDKALGLGDCWSIYSEVFNANTRTNVDIQHSLTLGEDIGVNFYVKPVAFVQDTDTVVTISKGDDVLVEAKFDEDHEASEMAGYYKFTGNVAAKEMADDLTIGIKKGNTTLWLLTGNTETYSVLDYAKVILADETTYAKEIPLVKAMLNYGGYAQTYFDYNTEAMANADLNITPEAYTLDNTHDKEITGSNFAGVTVSATLKLESKTQVVFTVNFGDDYADYTVNGEAVTAKTVEIITDGINAQSLNAKQTLTIAKGEATQTISYAPTTYLKNQAGNANTELVALLQALYAYHQAAATYAAA